MAGNDIDITHKGPKHTPSTKGKMAPLNTYYKGSLWEERSSERHRQQRQTLEEQIRANKGGGAKT